MLELLVPCTLQNATDHVRPHQSQRQNMDMPVRNRDDPSRLRLVQDEMQLLSFCTDASSGQEGALVMVTTCGKGCC